MKIFRFILLTIYHYGFSCMSISISEDTSDAWNLPEVRAWKAQAKAIQRSAYMCFGRVSWHDFGQEPDEELVLVKICFAIFGGGVSGNEERIDKAYNSVQKKHAMTTYNALIRMYRRGNADRFLLRIIFVVCKTADKECVLPIFSVAAAASNDTYTSKFYDPICNETYGSWAGWERSHVYPSMKYCFPESGRYSCQHDGYVFNPMKKPRLRCRVSCGVNVAVSFKESFSPPIGLIAIGVLAPFLMSTIDKVVAEAAVGWAGSRIRRNENCLQADLMNNGIWMSLLSGPSHEDIPGLSDYVANATPQRFREAVHVLCDLAQRSRLAADSALIASMAANLIVKSKHNEPIDVDVLHMSVSMFFFTNTLIQPRTVARIVEKYCDDFAPEGYEHPHDVNQVYRHLNDHYRGDRLLAGAQMMKAITRTNNVSGFYTRPSATGNNVD